MTVWLSVLTATFLLLSGSSTVLAQDEALGRLFYTPGQRAALDANIRTTNKAKKIVPLPPSVTFNGVVTRSDGERTVWIDGRAYHRAESGDVQVITQPTNPAKAEIKIQGVRRRMPVRVGQRLDPATGKTYELYEQAPGVTYNLPPAAADEFGAESASQSSEQQ